MARVRLFDNHAFCNTRQYLLWGIDARKSLSIACVFGNLSKFERRNSNVTQCGSTATHNRNSAAQRSALSYNRTPLIHPYATWIETEIAHNGEGKNAGVTTHHAFHE